MPAAAPCELSDLATGLVGRSTSAAISDLVILDLASDDFEVDYDTDNDYSIERLFDSPKQDP